MNQTLTFNTNLKELNIFAKKFAIINKPSIVLLIDFGEELGIKKSSAQLLNNYNPDQMINKQIAAVVNFKPKQIGNIMSEVLVLGFPNEKNEPILISPDKKIKNGVRLY